MSDGAKIGDADAPGECLAKHAAARHAVAEYAATIRDLYAAGNERDRALVQIDEARRYLDRARAWLVGEKVNAPEDE